MHANTWDIIKTVNIIYNLQTVHLRVVEIFVYPYYCILNTDLFIIQIYLNKCVGLELSQPKVFGSHTHKNGKI